MSGTEVMSSGSHFFLLAQESIKGERGHPWKRKDASRH